MMLLLTGVIVLASGAGCILAADDTVEGAYLRALGCVWGACGVMLGLLAVALWWRA